jgi:hypothetical protein
MRGGSLLHQQHSSLAPAATRPEQHQQAARQQRHLLQQAHASALHQQHKHSRSGRLFDHNSIQQRQPRGVSLWTLILVFRTALGMLFTSKHSTAELAGCGVGLCNCFGASSQAGPGSNTDVAAGVLCICSVCILAACSTLSISQNLHRGLHWLQGGPLEHRWCQQRTRSAPAPWW